MKSFSCSEVQSLRLFDANCFLGASDLTVESAPVSTVRLLEEMDRLGIGEALVYHASAAGYAPVIGNQKLMDEIATASNLHACWVVMPHYTGEINDPRALVEEILTANVKAVRLFPSRHRFSLSSWSLNELLEELSVHKLPLFLDSDRSHWADEVVDYDQVFRICKEFADLPVILVREGIGSTRYLYPLLEKLENFYIEVSYYQTPGGLEDITKKFGAKHLLFGTGVPRYSAGPAVTMLLLSELSLEEKKMIGGDNLRNLFQDVVR